MAVFTKTSALLLTVIWHHVVVTCIGNICAVHFYLDGESVEEHLGPTESTTAMVHCFNNPTIQIIEGRVDDLGIGAVF